MAFNPISFDRFRDRLSYPEGTVPAQSEIDRQRNIAASLGQARQSAPPITHWLQGINQVAQSAVEGLTNRKASQGQELRQQAQTEALAGVIDWAGFGLDPNIGRQLLTLNPELGNALLGMQIEDQRAQQPEAYTLGPGQGRYVGDEQIAFNEAPEGPQTIINNNVGSTGIDYGDPPTDHVWQRDPEANEIVLDDRGAPVAIPVGPALADQQAAEDAAAAARNAELTSANIVLEDIEKALELAGGWTTGFVGNLIGGIPGTPAYDLARTLDTIKANVGFDRLQEMRNNSPTGGALGQVSEMENRLLQSVLGNLERSQSREQFDANLNRLREVYLDIVHGPGAWSFDAEGNAVIGGGEEGDAGAGVAVGAEHTLEDGRVITAVENGWRFPDGVVRVWDGAEWVEVQ